VFDFVREMNKAVSEGIGKGDAKLAYETMLKFDTVLGLELGKVKLAVGEKIKIKDSIFTIHWQGIKPNPEVEKLIKKRGERRKEKSWKEADKVRDKVKEMGYILEDMENGVKVKKA
ncbi:MAG: hypothetical protein KAU24_03410, partial [Candidatus Aenigmarchaeota archaeon]|nr:hypothetical protein [Candidatus Aenigmarchaeota archaeon]